MRLEKRGERWKVEIYDPRRANKKRYVGTYGTEREAKEAGLRADLEVLSLRRRRGDETVVAWSKRWLELRPRQKESTNAGYREQVKAFVNQHGDLRLRDVGVELALEWARDHRWTHGGLRAMFSDARRADLIEHNPFAGLRLSGTRGRKDLDVLTRAEVERLAECATEVWAGEVALSIRTLVLCGCIRGDATGRAVRAPVVRSRPPKRGGARRAPVLRQEPNLRAPQERPEAHDRAHRAREGSAS